MKKWLAIGLSIALVLGVVGLFNLQEADATSWSFEDATYRGNFSDGGNDQVNIQFTLEDNVVTSTRYRHLWYGGTDYGDLGEGDALYGVVEQYDQVLEYLEGKDIRSSLEALYEPGDVIDDVDAFSGATLRANKVISAVRDALNRGAYSY